MMAFTDGTHTSLSDNTLATYNGQTYITGISTTGINDFTYTYQPIPADQYATLRGEIDNMRVRVEALIALVEKLEIESRYWHLKARLLEEKSLSQ
jgi:hypothetical protein